MATPAPYRPAGALQTVLSRARRDNAPSWRARSWAAGEGRAHHERDPASRLRSRARYCLSSVDRACELDKLSGTSDFWRVGGGRPQGEDRDGSARAQLARVEDEVHGCRTEGVTRRFGYIGDSTRQPWESKP